MAVQSLMILMISYGNALGAQYLLASRRTRAYTGSAFAGLVINVIGNIILIPLWGALGAIISSVITEFVVSFYQAYALRDIFTITELTKGVWKYIIAAMVACPIMYYLDSILINSLVNYAFLSLVGTVIYVIGLWLLKANVFTLVKNVKLK